MVVGVGIDCRVIGATGDMWRRRLAAWDVIGGGGGGIGQIGGGFSNESEHDLAVMVSEFLEEESSVSESKWSSDSDGSFSDLAQLPEKICYMKKNMHQYEQDTYSVVKSHILSIIETDLQLVNTDHCNSKCIRFSLVKLLRLSGYDAGVCSSKWEGSSKVPGGDHEYIDVVYYDRHGNSERLIIDIDFQNHFEIARAVESYNRILKSLPVVFVGSITKLEQFLQVMVEAARYSLKQSSMPFPPWRSLAYLQAKWESPYQRKLSLKNKTGKRTEHKQCNGHLKHLQSSIHSEIKYERRLKTTVVSGGIHSKVMFDTRRTSLFKKF